MDERIVEEVVHATDESYIRKFLIRLLRGDEGLFTVFREAAVKQFTPEMLEEERARINDIFMRYAGDYGFIDYENVKLFTEELEECIDKDIAQMLADELFEPAFDLSSHIYLNIALERSGADPEEAMREVTESCVGVWQQILRRCDEDMEGFMFSWFDSYMNICPIPYVEEQLANIMMNYFDRECFRLRKVEILEARACQEE